MWRACCRSGQRKANEVTANVYPISDASRRGHHLQRSGTPQISVLRKADGKQIVAANVHNDKCIGGKETTPIRTRFKSMAFNVDRGFSDEIGLIFFLHR